MYVLCIAHVVIKLTNCYISVKHAKPMAAGDASQTTPVQTTHILCCVVLQKLSVCNFDSCKDLTCFMVC